MKKLQSEDAPKQFATILAARQTCGNAQPSDLEYRLQSECKTLRVVERLHGGAHLLIPKVGGNGNTSSLALRVYHECDSPLQQPISSRGSEAQQTQPQQKQGATEYLENFFGSFQLAIVFFLLPTPGIREAQLNRGDSLFHLAQKLAHPRLGRSCSSPTIKNRTARVYIAPDANAAMSILNLFVQQIRQKDSNPPSALLRQQYADFWPPPPSLEPILDAYRAAASAHVVEVLRQWGQRFEILPADISVLITTMRTLPAATNLTPDIVEVLPVSDRTKSVFCAFFGGDKAGRDNPQDYLSNTGIVGDGSHPGGNPCPPEDYPWQRQNSHHGSIANQIIPPPEIQRRQSQRSFDQFNAPTLS